MQHEFISSPVFLGARQGYVFKNGMQVSGSVLAGLGWSGPVRGGKGQTHPKAICCQAEVKVPRGGCCTGGVTWVILEETRMQRLLAVCATGTTPEHAPRQAAHSTFSVHCVNAQGESLAVTVPSAPRSQGLGYYLDDPARAHEEWLASRAATAAAPGGAIGPAGPGRGGGGGGDDDERLPRKSRLEVIAERQRQRNEGRGRGGGGKAKEDEELDPMDPVRRTRSES